MNEKMLQAYSVELANATHRAIVAEVEMTRLRSQVADLEERLAGQDKERADD